MLNHFIANEVLLHLACKFKDDHSHLILLIFNPTLKLIGLIYSFIKELHSLLFNFRANLLNEFIVIKLEYITDLNFVLKLLVISQQVFQFLSLRQLLPFIINFRLVHHFLQHNLIMVLIVFIFKLSFQLL